MGTENINLGKSSNGTNLPSMPELNNDRVQRRRRGGAIPFAAGAGMNAAKIAIVLSVCTGVGIAGAIANYFAGKDLAAQRARDRAANKTRVEALASARNARPTGDMSNLPMDRTAGGDSLSMLNSMNRGGMGDEANGNPADAAAQGGDANADGSAQGNSGENAAPNANGAAAGGQGAGNAAGANGINSARLGQLSSGAGARGGGMSGGSGMSGGVGRGFDQMGKGQGAGDLLAMARSATPTTGRTASSRPVSVSKGGANLSRLGNMSSAMKPTASMGDLQRGSQIQTDQWSSGQTPGGGQAITGSGDSLGGLGAGENAEPSPSGGPTMNPNNGSAPEGAPDIGQTANATPWQGMLDMARTLLMAAAGLVILAGLLNWKGWLSDPITAQGWWSVARVIAAMAAAMATAALVIGGMIMMQYNQMGQGMVLMLGGASILGAAAMAMTSAPGEASNLWAILGGAIGFGSSFMASQGQNKSSNQ